MTAIHAQSVMDNLTDITGNISGAIYTWLLVPLLLAVGVYFTVRTRFTQVRLFFTSIKTLLERPSDKQAMSPFQALMISTASRVGTGNIAGVSTAIIVGGPGAIFWMWLIACIGAASALVESTLAQVYKVRGAKGFGFRGGPAFYIQRALGKRWLGMVFSVCLIATFAFGFNALQANNITVAFDHYFESSFPVHALIGIVLAVATGLVILGGPNKIKWVTSVMVPAMAVIYLGMGLVVVAMNLDSLGSVFGAIFSGAFDFKTIFGGFAGSAVLMGVKRGLFSNEAGMGSAPNAAASAETSHPVKQGLVQMLSVFIDTMLICSTSAFLILSTGVYQPGVEQKGMALVQEAVKSQFGELGVFILTVSILLFAFSSIIGNYFYTESNVHFIRGKESSLFIFRLVVVAVVWVGSVVGYDLAWNVADIVMAAMTLVNIVAIVWLSPIASRVIKDFYRQYKAGKDPVFIASQVGLTNTDWWQDPAPKP
jgi:AGCS family alanine or glycine:cation symporter